MHNENNNQNTNSTDQVKVDIELITPDRARELLTINTHNRPMSKLSVTKLAKEIRAGNWQFNADPIRISTDHVLLDGQHRLQAIVDTGVELKMMVVSGLNPEVFTTIDQGITRTLGHLLALQNIKNYAKAASIVPLLHTYRMGQVPGSSLKWSKTDLLKYFNENHLIEPAASFVVSSQLLKKWIAPGYLGFLYVIFAEINQQQADYFFRRVEDGSGLASDDPEFMLREKLIKIMSSSGVREDMKIRAAYFIQAWNAVRKHSKIKYFRYTYQGEHAQSFPKAI